MKVIVGSSDLWPTPALASAILMIMTSTEEKFGVRCTGRGQATSAIEDMTMRIGSRLGREVTEWPPVDPGSSSAFKRDVNLVDHSSEVFAFFAPGQLMQGGTGHVVTCALRKGVAVHAFELDSEGMVIESASDEGDLMSLWENQ